VKGVLDFVSSPTSLIHEKEVAVLQGAFQGVREKDEKKVPVRFTLELRRAPSRACTLKSVPASRRGFLEREVKCFLTPNN